MSCDMCGTNSELYRCKIESTYLNVCKQCGGFGEIIEKVKEPIFEIEKPIQQQTVERSEIIQIIDPNYSTILKNKREQIGLKQKELAQKIAEKESLIHKIESGNMRPSVALARKLEKFLKITLVQQYREDYKSQSSTEEISVLTIGDLIKKK